MKARRSVLQNFRPQPGSTHIGLWLDKYLEEQEEKNGSGSKGTPRSKHYQRAVALSVPPVYSDFYQRWKQDLQTAGARMVEAKVKTRMVVGLGAESVLETAITLHRTYGVPYIPGSALKGLAATFARKYLKWDPEGEDYKILFGDTKAAGFVTFFDALYVRGSATNDQPLALDIITVHHPDYYRGANAAPADWDNPTPVPFVTAQGRYLIALAGPDGWVDAAFQILEQALEVEGVGAKTAIGYGRLELYWQASGSAGSSAPPQVEKPNGKLTTQQAQSEAEEHPSKDWDWRKGRIDRSGKYVIDAEDPNKKYRFDRKHIIPKGYTPPRKAEVQYALRQQPDGSQVVWVRKKYHPLLE